MLVVITESRITKYILYDIGSKITRICYEPQRGVYCPMRSNIPVLTNGNNFVNQKCVWDVAMENLVI
jgi:hypothetical protein